MFAVGIIVVAFGLLGYFLVRNELVYRYRIALLDEVSDASRQDIENDRPWIWRYDKYNSVSYYQMVLSFKKFDSFYPDKGLMCYGNVSQDSNTI